jgi:hypothetical protein
MARGDGSLLHGRNNAPLDERQQQQVISLFFGMDAEANVRYDEGSRTVFREVNEGEVNHEIVFGPDIYPGGAIADPNAILGVKCAVAHELSHKARHDDMTEINEEELQQIDEALTSLGAILRFHESLNPHQIRQLVSDASQRLQEFVREYRARAPAEQEQNGAGAA